jgi:hypothetical protein
LELFDGPLGHGAEVARLIACNEMALCYEKSLELSHIVAK